MVPWVAHPELLARQQSYDPVAFRNECLGLPTTLGDHIVTREETEACCTPDAMAASLCAIPPSMRNRMLAGVDWGGGGVSRTVVVIGYIDNEGKLVIRAMIGLPAREDPDLVIKSVGEICERFQVRGIAADGAGNGTVYNRLLLERLPRLPCLIGMQYAATDHAPKRYGSHRWWSWIIARSPSLGAVFSQIKRRRIFFPQLQQCAAFLREIYCETAEYDAQNRSVRYIHPENQADDTLHALTYLSVLASGWYRQAAANGALNNCSFDFDTMWTDPLGQFP